MLHEVSIREASQPCLVFLPTKPRYLHSAEVNPWCCPLTCSRYARSSRLARATVASEQPALGVIKGFHHRTLALLLLRVRSDDKIRLPNPQAGFPSSGL